MWKGDRSGLADSFPLVNCDHTSHDNVSVVRTTFKAYAKRQTLTLSQPKTPEPIVTKFEWCDYVVDAYHQKIGLNPPRGFCSPYRWNIHPSCSKFTTLFWCFNSPTGESVRPIFALNIRQMMRFCARKCLFLVIESKFYFSFIYSKNSKKKLQLNNSLNCHNFRCVQDRVIIFG